MDFGGRLCPIDNAVVAKNFGSGSCFALGKELVLWYWSEVAGNDVVDGLDSEVGTEKHKAVVDRANGFIFSDFNALLLEDVTGVDFVLEHECGDTGLRVAIHYSAVDGSGTAVSWQKRGVEVESTQWRHLPHFTRKHTERNDDEQIGTRERNSSRNSGSRRLSGCITLRL